MYEGINNWSFLLGLPVGILVAGIPVYFYWRKGKKERHFDERYNQVHQQARSISWFVMYFLLLITWGVAIIVEGFSLVFFLFAGLWLIHLLSYFLSAFIVAKKK